MKQIFLVLTGVLFTASLYAQEISFTDTVTAYNVHRIHTNKTGMLILGAWGVVNMAEAGIGYFSANRNEWKYFHAMNALWGVTNAGIAAMGLSGTRKELVRKTNAFQSYDRYRANKRLYLINAGLDVVYIASGVAMTAYSADAKTHKDLFGGFGRSVTLQGVFLLLFDNCMFAAHLRYNSRWFRIMNEIRVSNAGVGFNYTF